MSSKRKGPAKGAPSRLKPGDGDLTAYEIVRRDRLLENNARMRQLGLRAISEILTATSNIMQQKDHPINNEDPDFLCTTEDEDGAYSEAEGNETAPGSSKKKRTSKKAKMSENSDVPRHGMRSKRVLAPSQPGRVTRSGKVLRPQIDVTTESEMPIQVASEVHATETEVLRAQVDATTQAASQVHGANIEQDGPAVTVHTQEGINEASTINEANQTNMNENADDDSLDEEEWTRGPNVGIGLDKMSRSKRGKLPVVIEPGKIRPNSVKIAAKFATECNIAVRNHVPIFPHWKHYKNQHGLKKFYISKVASRFDMDQTAAPVKKACIAMMKKGIRQQRYKLKKKYYDPYPLHLVPKKTPVKSMNDVQWLNLVDHWKSENKMLLSEKNKENRSKVQFHQTTGSRSYDMHIVHLEEKYKDAPPNALDLFKDTHYSNKKNAFAPAVQSAIVEMESKIAETPKDGCEPKSAEDAVSEVLVGKTKKNNFLKNVGIKNAPGASCGGNRREIEAELALEKQTTADLREVVNKQHQQLDEMVKKMQAAEEERAKREEEMRQKQAETDAILRRVMAMLATNQPTS